MVSAANSHNQHITMTKMMRKPFSVLFWLLLVNTVMRKIGAEQQCEQLSPTLEYTQEDAPRDLAKAISIVNQQVNRALGGVVDVNVEWSGSDVNGEVGHHWIRCTVTRLASFVPPEALQGREVQTDHMGRQVVPQCFVVPFTVHDTNECTLPIGHDMRHQCQEPAICVNTIGSYECLCPKLDGSFPPSSRVVEDPGSHTNSIDVAGELEAAFFEGLQHEPRNAWELSKSTPRSSSCASRPSTRGCCPPAALSRDGEDCRAQFVCPMDPCAENAPHKISNNNCSSNAQCVRIDSPWDDPSYNCVCPEGLLGNGLACQKGDPKPEPKITYEGYPTDETIKKNYCGCTKPVVDACSGFPPCTNKHEVCVVNPDNTPTCGCKKGFVKHEQYGCVDETPPTLKLINDPRGDKILRLKQGDFYEEFGVRVVDENAEDYHRLLKISYSDALPQGCLTKVGEFTVNYTISTPWTHPPSIWVTRRVVIEDIDECSLNVVKYGSTCPQLIPRCDTEAGAKCVNTVGSYTCECPKFTSGDGFLSETSFSDDNAPDGYQGGTGCVDTSKPVIELKGPNPKFFKVCPCSGISGIMQDKSRDSDLCEAQRAQYERDIKNLIASTQGAELCASHEKSRPQPANCVYAYDETYKGRVDLSRRVKIGDPVKKSSLHWVVPYNVIDDAGNEATTIWRDVVVDEVDLESLEAKLRDEIGRSKDSEIKAAVNKAIQEERRKLESTNSKPHVHRRSMTHASCPPCPACPENAPLPVTTTASPSPDKINLSICEKICEERGQQCSFYDNSSVISLLLLLEQHLPAEIVPVILGLAAVMAIFFLFTVLKNLLYNPAAFAASYDYAYDQERERSLQNSVTYYPGGSSPPHQTKQYQPSAAVARTPHTAGGMAGGPPRASLSRDQGSDFFLSPGSAAGGNGGAGTFASPPGVNGTQQQVNGNAGLDSIDDPNGIYMSPPIILPSPRNSGSELRRRSPGGY